MKRVLIMVAPVIGSLAGQLHEVNGEAVGENLHRQYDFFVQFYSVDQLLEQLTPRRLKILAKLRSFGPLSVNELAVLLDGAEPELVLTDVDKLFQLRLVSQKDQHRVFTPFTHFDIRLQ